MAALCMISKALMRLPSAMAAPPNIESSTNRK
jgi:hypothetical protein